MTALLNALVALVFLGAVFCALAFLIGLGAHLLLEALRAGWRLL